MAGLSFGASCCHNCLCVVESGVYAMYGHKAKPFHWVDSMIPGVGNWCKLFSNMVQSSKFMSLSHEYELHAEHLIKTAPLGFPQLR